MTACDLALERVKEARTSDRVKRRPLDDAGQIGPPRAAGLAQIGRTGWFKQVRIKSHGTCVVRVLLSARDLLVSEQMPGLLKAFGVIFGKKIDAQVILHMLRIQATQVYHDPLRAGINDVQELSKTHEAIARAKTEIQHRMLTHYQPLYFPEIDRFRGNSRSDWFFAFLHAFPTPATSRR